MTELQKIETAIHESQHVKDFLRFPNLTHMATHNVLFKAGSGFARYFFEYRAHAKALGKKIINPFKPLWSFTGDAGVAFSLVKDLVITGGLAATYLSTDE